MPFEGIPQEQVLETPVIDQPEGRTFKTHKYNNGDVYEGEFVGHGRDGKGTMTYTNGDLYVGEWVSDDKHGQGKMTYADGTYMEGQWFEDVLHGEGTHNRMAEMEGSGYVGTWTKGKMTGSGKETWTDGKVYDGQYQNSSSMARASSHGIMEPNIKVSSGTISFMAMGPTNGKMGAPIQVNGLMTKCTVKVSICSRINESTKDSTKTAKSMVMVCSLGLMVAVMLGSGGKENNMEKE